MINEYFQRFKEFKKSIVYFQVYHTLISQPSTTSCLKCMSLSTKFTLSGTLYLSLLFRYICFQFIQEKIYKFQERLEAGGLRILDVGCGNGSHMSLMAEKYPKCQFIGIDIAEAAIQEAKSRRYFLFLIIIILSEYNLNSSKLRANMIRNISMHC